MDFTKNAHGFFKKMDDAFKKKLMKSSDESRLKKRCFFLKRKSENRSKISVLRTQKKNKSPAQNERTFGEKNGEKNGIIRDTKMIFWEKKIGRYESRNL